MRRTISLRWTCLLGGISLWLLFGMLTIRADEVVQAPLFEKDIQPLLKAKCTRCHGEERQRADLNLTTLAGVLKGGESGPAVVPGDLKKSKLFAMVHEGLMPPSKKLPPQEQQLLEQWIRNGAPALSGKTTTVAQLTQHDVLPLLLLRCSACHGLRRQEGGLDVRSKEALLRGGKSGPAIVLGKPVESLLLKRIHAGQMPPRKRLLEVSVKPMAQDELARLSQWIEMGAPEMEIQPDVATTEPDPLVSERDREFWSFQPPRKVQPPKVADPRICNPIDAFVVAKLREKGLKLAPEADRLTLLRRATFDLTGLAPEPEEVEAFVKDGASDAYEKLIDRLLASPRYGERWGRYWLDLAGYADSEGKRSADPIRPHAWRYRDYVVRSFNADKPYDRFLLEQLAGDELADYEKAPQITQEIMDNLTATGFLRLTPDGTGSDVVNFVPDRLDVIADEMQVLGSAVLGLTVHCARCHSHKYDPIPQRDYYRLLAVFKGAFDEHDWLRPTSVKGQTKGTRPDRVLPFVTTAERQQWEKQHATLQTEIAELKKRKATPEITRKLRELESQVSQPGIHALWDRGTPSPTYIYRRGDYLQPGKLVGPGVLSVLTDGKTPFNVIPPWPGARATGRRLAFARWLVQPDHPLTARVLVNRIWHHHFGSGLVKTLDNFGRTGSPPSHPDLLDWLARECVAPSTQSSTPGRSAEPRRSSASPAGSPGPASRAGPTEQGQPGQSAEPRRTGDPGRSAEPRRTGASPAGSPGPVLGRKLAGPTETPRPWSIKHLHRLLMTSATYRQSSALTEEHLKADPDNVLLSRMPLKRMQAEVIYDTTLQVSGQLDLTPFGPPDPVETRKDGLVTPKGTARGWRRSLYVLQRRSQMPTLLETFDLPQMNPNCIQRIDSTVSSQALYLRNNGLIHDLAAKFAERVQRRAGAAPPAQVEAAYLLALSRPPTAEEKRLGVESLTQLAAAWRPAHSEAEAQLQALNVYCHTLLNSAAFVYID